MPEDGLHPDSSSDEEIKRLTIQLRLEAVKDANKRARLAFLVSTIASLAILITVWNAYDSWTRFIPFLKGGEFTSTGVTQSAQKELLSEWVRSQTMRGARSAPHHFLAHYTISVGFLGIRVSIFDAALLGSVSIFVISIWFFYSLRRANRTIASLLWDTRDEMHVIMNMIYHGVVNQLIFAETGHDDKMGPDDLPISRLDDVPATPRVTLFVRYSYQALFLLPAAVLSIVVGDMLSLLVLAAPFREGTPVLLEHLKHASAADWTKLVVMESVAVYLTIETLRLCLKGTVARNSLRREVSIGSVRLGGDPEESPDELRLSYRVPPV